MAIVPNPENRYWRTDVKHGRSVYALVSNDVKKPSEHDPLIGVMETSQLAQVVVDTHNGVLAQFGKQYLKRLDTNG